MITIKLVQEDAEILANLLPYLLQKMCDDAAGNPLVGKMLDPEQAALLALSTQLWRNVLVSNE